MNKKVLLKIVKYIASLGFAFGILYLLFKNQDPVKLIEEIQKVDGKMGSFINDLWRLCLCK